MRVGEWVKRDLSTARHPEGYGSKHKNHGQSLVRSLDVSALSLLSGSSLALDYSGQTREAVRIYQERVKSAPCPSIGKENTIIDSE